MEVYMKQVSYIGLDGKVKTFNQINWLNRSVEFSLIPDKDDWMQVISQIFEKQIINSNTISPSKKFSNSELYNPIYKFEDLLDRYLKEAINENRSLIKCPNMLPITYQIYFIFLLTNEVIPIKHNQINIKSRLNLTREIPQMREIITSFEKKENNIITLNLFNDNNIDQYCFLTNNMTMKNYYYLFQSVLKDQFFLIL
jgi:hypothetical protein